jgi:hypothetical protein
VRSKRTRQLIADLNKELNSSGSLDPETRELLRRLNEDVDPASALDRAKRLESQFAASHPVVERIARELVDTLAKMGI